MIHPTADIAAGVSIGPGTKIWHYVQVREGARIGSSCILGRAVYVDAAVVIGDNCKLQNGVAVYGPSVLEDGVFLGPRVVVTNDRIPRAVTPDGVLKDASEWTATGAVIRQGAAVGAACVLLPGVTIGRWAMVGAGSVVSRPVPDYGLAVGNPARLVGHVCPCGVRLQRQGPTESAHCTACGRVTQLGDAE
ncbi:MAG: acyltransferase [Acidimicrobiales bacterium]